MVHDITERKRFEERIVHLASFPEHNPNPVMELSLAGKIIYVNPAIGRILKELGLPEGDPARGSGRAGSETQSRRVVEADSGRRGVRGRLVILVNVGACSQERHVATMVVCGTRLSRSPHVERGDVSRKPARRTVISRGRSCRAGTA